MVRSFVPKLTAEKFGYVCRASSRWWEIQIILTLCCADEILQIFFSWAGDFYFCAADGDQKIATSLPVCCFLSTREQASAVPLVNCSIAWSWFLAMEFQFSTERAPRTHWSVLESHPVLSGYKSDLWIAGHPASSVLPSCVCGHRCDLIGFSDFCIGGLKHENCLANRPQRRFYRKNWCITTGKLQLECSRLSS